MTNNKPNSTVGYSQLSDKEILDKEHVAGAQHYGRIELIVRKTEGCWLYDNEGNKYFDCLAAYSAANQGHHHPRMVKAIKDAVDGQYGSVISNVVYTDSLAMFVY